jgi:membrane carboxypeptidase/penicillin-binding protein
MKILKSLTLVLLAAAALLAIYGAVTAARAYAAAPEVVARAMATWPMTLRSKSLPAGYREILLSVEDPAFDSHHGIDLWTPGAGYTTITQGLVKFLYFDRFRPGVAKVSQIFIALGFDLRIDKETQMTLFLNSVYMGTKPGGKEVHGLDEAARVYFKKALPSLSRNEFISLVAMIVGPDAYSVDAAPGRNAERVRRIQRLLDGKCRPRDFRDVYYEDCAQERIPLRPASPVG